MGPTAIGAPGAGTKRPEGREPAWVVQPAVEVSVRAQSATHVREFIGSSLSAKDDPVARRAGMGLDSPGPIFLLGISWEAGDGARENDDEHR
jgi:hypothetical protein